MNTNAKQKNKPFKGSKNRSQSHKVGVTKKISKVEKEYKKSDLKNMKNQLIENTRLASENIHRKVLQYAQIPDTLKPQIARQMAEHSEPKVILLVPMSETADCKAVAALMRECYPTVQTQAGEQQCFTYPYT